MKLICGLYVITLLVVISTQSSPYLKCKKGEMPIEIRGASDCTRAPCRLRRGTNVTAEWDFIVPENTTTLKPRLRYGHTANRINSNFPFPQQDACETLKDSYCPLEAGENVTYVLEMPISRTLPPVPLAIEFSLIDDNNNVIVCFKFIGKVV